MPVRLRLPLPVLVNETVPLPFWITPENTVLELSPPAVKVTAPALELVMVPPPLIEPTAWEKPAMSKVAPLATVVVLLLPSPLAAPAFSVPPVTLVEPL